MQGANECPYFAELVCIVPRDPLAISKVCGYDGERTPFEVEGKWEPVDEVEGSCKGPSYPGKGQCCSCYRPG